MAAMRFRIFIPNFWQHLIPLTSPFPLPRKLKNNKNTSGPARSARKHPLLTLPQPSGCMDLPFSPLSRRDVSLDADNLRLTRGEGGAALSERRRRVEWPRVRTLLARPDRRPELLSSLRIAGGAPARPDWARHGTARHEAPPLAAVALVRQNSTARACLAGARLS